MLKILLKKQFYELFKGYFVDAKKNKNRSKRSSYGLICLFAFLILIVGVSLGFMFVPMAETFSALDLPWMYYIMAGLFSILLGTFGSVFNTYFSLYCAKDNNMLLSMPIKPITVILARLLVVFIMGSLYCSVVYIPSVIVWYIFAPFKISTLIGQIVFYLVLSLIVFTLSCGLGFLVALITKKIKSKAFFTVFLALVIIGAYYFFYFKANTLITDLLTNAVLYGNQIIDSAYFLYMFGKIGTGDLLSSVVYLGGFAIIISLLVYLLNRTFIKIVTYSKSKSNAEYKHKKTKRQSVLKSLFIKELKRFSSSPNYMLNCGLSIIILFGLGIASLFYGENISSLLVPMIGNDNVIITGCCAVLVLLSSTCDVAAPSLSLEGKAFWHLKCLPIKSTDVLKAKVLLQVVLSGISTLFCAVCFVIAFKFNVVQSVLVIVLPLTFVLLSSIISVVCGLKFVNLNWTNEIIPIKQSLSVVISMFSGWVIAAIMLALYFIIGPKMNVLIFLLIILALFIVSTVLLYKWLITKGKRLLEETDG